MTVYFMDSSALVKYYIREPGTRYITGIMQNPMDKAVIAEITPVETISAVSRQKHDGHIPPRAARAIRLLLDRNVAREYAVIRLSPAIVARAKDLLEAHRLRAYDAVQLASAEDSQARLANAGLPPLIFLAADNRLLTVASTVGLQTDNPNNYP
jgi:hypothetical protein